MKIVKTKYKLVLKKPGDEEKIVCTGTKKFCDKKRLDLSFKYNSDWLVIEEEISESKEAKTTISGILGFLALCSLTYLCWLKNGKKIYIVD